MLRLQAWLASLGGRPARPSGRSSSGCVALEPSQPSVYERLADLALAGRGAGTGRRDPAAQGGRRDRARPVQDPDGDGRFAAPRGRAGPGRRGVRPLVRRSRAWWRLAARSGSVASRPRPTPPSPAWRPSSPRRSRRPDARRRARPDPAAARAREDRGRRIKLTIPRFADEAEARGLRFTFDHGPTERRQMPETMSGGVGLLDFDGDGWLDVYAVQGGPFPPVPGRPPFGDRLFRNRGDGRFEDATVVLGPGRVPRRLRPRRGGRRLRQRRPARPVRDPMAVLRPVSQPGRRPVRGRHRAGGARRRPRLADLGRVGRPRQRRRPRPLCLPLSSNWDETRPVLCGKVGQPEIACTATATRATSPRMPDHVFRNDGGRFVNVTAEAGIVDRDGRGLGVVAADLDDDGKHRPLRGQRHVGQLLLPQQGRIPVRGAGRGVGPVGRLVGRLPGGDGDRLRRPRRRRPDRPGRHQLLRRVDHALSQPRRRPVQRPVGRVAGLAAATRFMLGFGLAALDANNDGRLDLVQANGHIDDYRPTMPFEMPAAALPGRRSWAVSSTSRVGAGPPWQVLRVARGLAVGDMDNDGRVDVLLVAQQAPLSLLRNEPGTGGHFADARPRGGHLQPRRRRRQGDGHGRGPDPGGDAVRRGELSSRPATRGCISGWARRSRSIASRSPGRRAVATRTRASRRTAAIGCARATRRPGHWPASPAPVIVRVSH